MKRLIKYKDFPQALKDRVDEIRKEQDRIDNDFKDERSLAGLFHWENTKEGNSYWRKLYDSGDFSDFEVKEKLKDKVIKSISKKGIRHIIEVEDMYGSTYSIGDKVKLVDKTNNPVFKNKTYFKILDFRWTNDNSKICAIINSNFPNGISLDKLEHYVEFKKETEFVLPEKWCIKWGSESKYKIIQSYLNKINPRDWRYIIESLHSNAVVDYKNSYYGSVIDMNYFLKLHSDLTEITFEQFEQYVLHNGFKVGDRFTKQSFSNQHVYMVNEKEIIDLQYIDGCSVAFYKLVDNNYSGSQCRILTKNIVK